jgi:hypothetical protein
MSSKETRALKMKTNQYVLVSGIVFRRNIDGILLICLDHSRANQTLVELHKGIWGGKFSLVVIAYTIIKTGYHWPTMFKYAYSMTRKFISCQKFPGKMKRESIPLNPMSIEEPFAKWGLDVIGMINLKSNKGNSYILNATDYFTKLKEVVALETIDTKKLIMFLKDNILAIFGVPHKSIIDNGSSFIGYKFT